MRIFGKGKVHWSVASGKSQKHYRAEEIYCNCKIDLLRPGKLLIDQGHWKQNAQTVVHAFRLSSLKNHFEIALDWLFFLGRTSF